MPPQETEFKFPHEIEDNEVQPLEIEPALNVTEDVLNLNKEKEEVEVEVEVEAKTSDVEEEEVEVEDEIINDVPPEDRGRIPSDPPEDVTEEELRAYQNKKAQDRIKHFAKGYHDERRKAEAAERKSAELQEYAKSLLTENEKLKGTVHQGRSSLIDQAKKTVEAEMVQAEKEFSEAYATGEPDKVLAAQKALTAASIKKDRLDNFKMAPLQKEQNGVQVATETPPANVADPKVTAWRAKNKWYGPDTVMTATALGLNRKLIEEDGHDGQSDEYYEALDTQIRQIFPDKFKEEVVKDVEKPTNVVAPVARTVAPRKIRLNETQVAIAKELGITNKGYAAQVAKLRRNTDGR